MRIPKHVLGFVAVLLLLTALGAGIYARINRAAADDGATADAPDGPAPDVSATDAFSTDMPIPVEGALVVRDTLRLAVSAPAQAVAWRQSDLIAQVAGQVRAIPVRENSRVGAGAIVLTIDPTEYQLSLEQAQAQLRKAQGTFREQTLFDANIADDAVRAERERASRAKSGLDDAEVGVKLAEMELARTRVAAPFEGRIANMKVVAGQMVRVGDVLMTVTDIDPIRVEAQVLESEIGYLTPGRTARVSFSAFPAEVFTGRIETINPIVDPTTRTAKVIVSVPNPDGRILPGFYARVSLDARQLADRILVPRAAILERDRRTMLFVFDGEGDEGRAKWRYVTTGVESGDLVEIVDNPDTEMVQPGEIVLVGGHYTLTHDAPVRVTENARAAGGRPE